jgi:hypothetical protein
MEKKIGGNYTGLVSHVKRIKFTPRTAWEMSLNNQILVFKTGHYLHAESKSCATPNRFK